MRNRRMLARLLGVVAVALAGLVVPVAGVGAATTLPPGFADTVPLAGLADPIAVAFSPDGRVFVAEKSGLVRVFDSLADPTATVFADLRTQVHNFWDRGLLGLALDPQFPTRPYVYVLYTYDAEPGGGAPRWGSPGVSSDGCPTPPGATTDGCVVQGRLSRLTASGNTMTGPEQVLVTGWCQQFPSHSIGTVLFGPDGGLYAGAGDGASFNYADYGQTKNPCGDPPGATGSNLSPPTAEGGALRSQSVRRPAGEPVLLSGSIIRVDPNTGAGLPGNPFAASSDPNARRIIAYGMRNPFRFTTRPGTNQIWVGEVGWSTWEEVDRIADMTDGVAENFGWPCYEGNARQSSYDGANLNLCESLYAGAGQTAPHYTYNHGAKVVATDACATGSSSITGVAFESGSNYPAEYAGALFFADSSRGCIWAMERGGATDPDPTRIVPFVSGATRIVQTLVGPGGDLFYVDMDGGALHRVVYNGANHPPTAAVVANPTSGSAPLTVTFDGSGSTDLDGEALSYAWDLDGDGQFDDSTAVSPSWTYAAGGSVTARLRVTDPHGAADTEAVTIAVAGTGNTPPAPLIDSPTAALHWKVGDPIAFSGHATDAQDGSVPAARLVWSVLLHHCPSNCHTHPVQDFPGVASGSFAAPDHEYPSYLELVLTATDSAGASASTSVRLDPQTVDLTFTTNPSGLQLDVFSGAVTAPATRTVIVGSSNGIGAPSPQIVAGVRHDFVSWSDGGGATHNIVAPATATTYTATYRRGPVAAWSFDAQGSGGTLPDASGRHPLNPQNPGAFTPTGGRYGGAMTFNGSTDILRGVDAADLHFAGAMTLEAWVRPTTTAGWRTVLMKERVGGLSYALYAGSAAGRPEGYAFLGGIERAVTGPSALPLNAWSHLATTYDGAALRYYVNGTLVATVSATGSIPASTSGLYVGGNTVWGEYFSGTIDEVRLYDRALSAAEVAVDRDTPVTVDTSPPTAPGSLTATGGLGTAQLTWTASTDDTGVVGYDVHRSTTAGFTPGPSTLVATVSGTSYGESGLAAGTYYYVVVARDGAGNTARSAEAAAAVTADTTPPSVSVTSPTSGATVSGTVTLAATASDNGVLTGVRFLVDGTQVGATDPTAPYSVSWDSRTVGNGSHTVTAIARDGAGLETTSAAVPVTVANTGPAGLVAAYNFDEGSGTTVLDRSGSGNAGTVRDTTWSPAGHSGGALSFNGSTSWVTVASSASLGLSSGMTLEAWVRPTAVGDWSCVLLRERSGGLSYGLYASDTASHASGYINTGGRDSGTAAPGTTATGAWTHLASTYDGTTLRLYVNGAQVASFGVSGALTASTGALRIGGNSIWGEFFAGLLDDVRVYNRALSAAEVLSDRDRPVS